MKQKETGCLLNAACYIRECTSLPDPLEAPGYLSVLSDGRMDKIVRYKNLQDRKRSLCAGMMIAEHLNALGHSPAEIFYTSTGRPCIPGMDFNISHAGECVVLALSKGSVGCDIEQLKDGRSGIAERFFSAGERAGIAASEEPLLSFFRIWTARESYVKYTGEGITLDFRKYEVDRMDSSGDPPMLEGDLMKADYLGAAWILRDQKRADCRIHQWCYRGNYVISLCCDR